MRLAVVFLALTAKMRSRKPGAKRSICLVIASAMSTVEPSGTWQ